MRCLLTHIPRHAKLNIMNCKILLVLTLAYAVLMLDLIHYRNAAGHMPATAPAFSRGL